MSTFYGRFSDGSICEKQYIFSYVFYKKKQKGIDGLLVHWFVVTLHSESFL